jgi:hypothetical protein
VRILPCHNIVQPRGKARFSSHQPTISGAVVFKQPPVQTLTWRPHDRSNSQIGILLAWNEARHNREDEGLEYFEGLTSYLTEGRARYGLIVVAGGISSTDTEA